MSHLLVSQEEMLLTSIRLHGRPVKRIRHAMEMGLSAEQVIQEMLELASAAFDCRDRPEPRRSALRAAIVQSRLASSSR